MNQSQSHRIYGPVYDQASGLYTVALRNSITEHYCCFYFVNITPVKIFRDEKGLVDDHCLIANSEVDGACICRYR